MDNINDAMMNLIAFAELVAENQVLVDAMSNKGMIIRSECMLPKVKGHMALLGLCVSLKAFTRWERLHGDMQDNAGQASIEAFTECGTRLRETLRDELSCRVLLAVDPLNLDLYLNPLTEWDSVINTISPHFVDIIDHISEAGRCRAMERYPACVFHLNCVLDIGLLWIKHQLPKIPIDVKQKPMWSRWLIAIDSYAKQTPEPPKASVLRQIVAIITAIKVPWRDEPTHAVRIIKDKNDARIIYEAINRTMELIASI